MEDLEALTEMILRRSVAQHGRLCALEAIQAIHFVTGDQSLIQDQMAKVEAAISGN